MSTIDERIEKHKQLLMNAERMFRKYVNLKVKWDRKYTFHQNAIHHLEVKKRKIAKIEGQQVIA